MAADEFLEWAHVHGKLYGTARKQVVREIAEGRDIILEVDVQGAASVRHIDGRFGEHLYSAAVV